MASPRPSSRHESVFWHSGLFAPELQTHPCTHPFMPLTMQDTASPPAKYRRVASERADSFDDVPPLIENQSASAPTSATSSATSSTRTPTSMSPYAPPLPASSAPIYYTKTGRRPVKKAVSVACESCRKRKIKVLFGPSPVEKCSDFKLMRTTSPKVQWKPAEMRRLPGARDRVQLRLGLS